MTESKIIKTLPQLTKITKQLKQAGKRIAFTNGCFDILHFAHIKLLKEAKKYADYLIVGVNSDSSIRKIKGETRPVVVQDKRIRLLAELDIIDYLILFNEETPLRLIKSIKPDVLLKGGDWRKKDIVGRNIVNSYKGKIITFPYLKGYSTTKIIQNIINKTKIYEENAVNDKIYRIIDANLNRLREGLRVSEEVVRFIKAKKNYTGEFKLLRQEVIKILNSSTLSTKKLLSSRNVDSDVGVKGSFYDLKRKNYKDIFQANIQRAEESLRVLEEFLKLIDMKISLKFRKLRFKVYRLEKKIYLDIW